MKKILAILLVMALVVVTCAVSFTASAADAQGASIFNVDFSQGTAELNGLASVSGSGTTVTYKTDATLNRPVAVFDGASGLGYTLSQAAMDAMQDGYTYEILYKLPAVPSAETDLACSMAGAGFGPEYEAANNRINYWQSFDGDTKSYRQLWYGNASVATDEWLHLVAVWNGDKIVGYLNGAKADEANPATKVLKFASDKIYIGGNTNSSGGFRDGTACEIAFVRIHDSAASATDVATMYTDALTPLEGNFEETYDTYDEMNLSGLGYNPANFINEIPSGSKTYTGISASNSVVLKFKWQATNQLDAADATLFNIGFDANWNYGKFGVWARADKFFFCYQLNDDIAKVSREIAPITSGTHDIELGRKLVLSGVNTGKYYVYVKVDGEVKGEGYTSAYTAAGYAKNNIVYFGGAQLADQRFADLPVDETYDTYDEITYDKLRKDGQPLPGTETGLSSQPTYTYDVTSPSHSAILKYRWTAGANATFHLYFDQASAFPFTLSAKYPDQGSYGTLAGPNGAWQLDPTNAANLVNLKTPLVSGQSYDIEYGRLKVTSGTNAGKYLVYLKVDGELISQYYYAGVTTNDGTYGNGSYAFSNQIVINAYGDSGAKIGAIPVPEVFDTFDEVTLSDLGLNPGNFTNAIPAGSYNYTATSSSYSVVLKFKWKASKEGILDNGDDSALCFSLDDSYKFSNAGMLARYSKLYSCYGDSQIKSQSATEFKFTPEGTHDVEFGRKYVLSGLQAGKYYVYLNIDGELLVSGYTDANYDYDKTNKIWFGGKGLSNQRFKDVAPPETYDTYDTVTYADFLKDGQPLEATTTLIGETAFSYNGTSASHSVVFKFGWKAGSLAKLHLYLDQSSKFPFALTIKYPNFGGLGANAGENGAWHINPANGSTIVQMTEPLTTGVIYNVEYGRLKVLSGANKGKYLVYLKVDGEDVASYYYDGVQADGTYGDGVQMNYNFFIEEYGVEGTVISGLHEHNMVNYDAKSASCTEIGHEAYTGCSDCAYAVNYVEIPQTGHIEDTFQENIGAYGYDEVVYCTECKQELSRKSIATDLVIGTQTKDTATRLVMKLCADKEVIEAYESVGFKIVIDGEESIVTLDIVYTGFLDGEETITAESLECTYVAIYEIGNITEAKSVTVQGIINNTGFGIVKTLK